MTHDQQVRAVHIRQRLPVIDSYIAHHELRAALPPAGCTEIELYTSEELREAEKLKAYKTALLADLAALEGQLELALS